MLVSRVRVRRRSSSRSTAGGWSGSPRSSRWVAVQALVGLSVLAVVSTGCQSNPKPPPLETADSSSATPTPSPTEAAPTMPTEAKGTSEAAAKAFVRHYVDTVNYAMRTGVTADLDRLAAPSCSTCRAIVDRIDEVYSEGGRLEGAGWTIISLRRVGGGKATTLGAAGIEIAPQTVVISGSSPSESPGSRGNLDLYLSHADAGWLIERLEATQ